MIPTLPPLYFTGKAETTMRAAGRTLTVGELYDALEGLPDTAPVRVVVEGDDHDGNEGAPVVAVDGLRLDVRLVATVPPKTELDDEVLDFLEQYARGKVIPSPAMRRTAADMLAGYGIRVAVRAGA